MKRANFLRIVALVTLCGGVVVGCKTMDVLSKGVTSVGVATGTISADQAESINKTAAATGKALEKFTPEQEYYLGRSVGATVLSQYKPFDNNRATQYVNLLGQTLAVASDRPETFGGYHFLILDTDEVNAIAAPGGLILVSRGLLRCCDSEDALAAVLAHEIGHVSLEHGVKAIGSARWKSAGMTAALETGKSLAGEQLAQALSSFEDCINDVTDRIMNSGYARSQEYQADKVAVETMKRLGYNPDGLRRMLLEMEKRVTGEDKKGFGKTHPDPRDRVKEIASAIAGATGEASGVEARQARFNKAMAGI